ncbi:hypothetical protein LK09_06080 [Microbacterium mangrovi]|uniref:HTH arsR-type domain-containing protein n=1 Tax=Microbacterium mangrovi TaxID=1348253 RepID=A0A0B2AAE0_9MICO|nr:SRPBCC domain-containing protein [Microbacterium mangrovi]KHK98542.1 hypothetical protein LK09_06080 [Microbacterium mangrovi]
MEVQNLLATLAEPTRFRIVELLATRASTVGEVAAGIGALQPQTTKHIQALEAAGVIRVHKLGRRRVARLDREAMSTLSAFFAALSTPDADDTVLEEYETAIRREESHRSDEDDARVLTFVRHLPASVDAVWAAWTDAAQAARWWAPPHFDTEVFDIAPRTNAPIRLVLSEGGGARYESIGRVEEVQPRRRLVFELAPIDAEGTPLFAARHTVTFAEEAAATTLTLRIAVSDLRPGAAPAVAGLQPGWEQLLDALARTLAPGS